MAPQRGFPLLLFCCAAFRGLLLCAAAQVQHGSLRPHRSNTAVNTAAAAPAASLFPCEASRLHLPLPLNVTLPLCVTAPLPSTRNGDGSSEVDEAMASADVEVRRLTNNIITREGLRFLTGNKERQII